MVYKTANIKSISNGYRAFYFAR